MASEWPLVHKSESSLKSLKTQNVHKWMIEDFKQRFSKVKVKQPDTFIRSAPFNVLDGEKEHTFQMYINKQGDEEGVEVDKMVSIWLELISKDPVDMFFVISLNDLFEKKTWHPTHNGICSFRDNFRSFGRKNLMEINNLPLFKGTVTIYANMEIHQLTSLKKGELPPELSDKRLCIDRAKMANLSDFTLICDNSEIKVHKVVLASNCNFFEGMFQHNCIESNNNEMKVIDTESDTLEQMIEFMYNRQPDRLPSDGASLMQLLEAADKYGFEFLHNCVERKLIENVLDVESSAYWLQHALHFNAKFLQSKAKKLLVANLAQITKTEEFAHLMLEFPDCLLDEN